ncbi:hypothetical protein VCRA2133E348_160070 [Vibrio crassostreae]|nr:hypothetical protein VCRA2133E348_160070 [Vibrio crassostreae]CAK3184964.1 hypothetical protein VCRA213O314_150072 [Vibrio crassostreae]
MNSAAVNLMANILLVEDDDDLAELVQMHLKFQGHDVVRTNSIEKAQRYIREASLIWLCLTEAYLTAMVSISVDCYVSKKTGRLC